MNGVIDNIKLQLPSKKLINLRGEIDYYGASYILSEYCGINLLNNPSLGNVAWIHGWLPDFKIDTDPRIVTAQNFQNKKQLILTSKLAAESYLRKNGYSNTYAIGLPVVYLKQRKIERLKNSLLVMPGHSLDYTTHNHWKFDKYVEEIEQISKYFKYIYICVHPSCLKHGYWAPHFQAKGYKIIEGIDLYDRNSLYRLQYLMSTFEYVTTNSFGSHIAYAAYFGAKVSIYGSYAEYLEEDFSNDPFYLVNPDLLPKVLYLTSYQKVKKELNELFVEPQEAIIRQSWGEYEVGLENKKKPSEIKKILQLNFFNSTLIDFNHYINRLRVKLKIRTRLKNIITKLPKLHR